LFHRKWRQSRWCATWYMWGCLEASSTALLLVQKSVSLSTCNPNLSFISKSHALFFLIVNHRFQFLNIHYGHCLVPRFLVLSPVRVRILLNTSNWELYAHIQDRTIILTTTSTCHLLVSDSVTVIVTYFGLS